jgi:hypothetical protein
MLDLVSVEQLYRTTVIGSWRRDLTIHIVASSDKIETAFIFENGQVTRRYAAGKVDVDKNYREIKP